MHLKDFKAGDRITIYVNEYGKLCAAESTSDYTLPVTIIRISGDDYIIGWTVNDNVPVKNPNIDLYTADNYGDSYPGFIAWMVASRTRRTAGYADGPCRQCSKQNSSQDKKCWWCQVSCPTDLKRKGP